ncbi:MAG: Cysteine-tRNA ligase [Parcubacteria group bacterium GW2011_GWC1_43_11b]|nr:MAG: Cysteine-tRNA ligase [Parcubacteria group bacterium GW2011_GWC1_43_11b]
MALTFYNTLGREKTEFTALKPPVVGIYSCGPTVYDYAHIGNLRAYVFADLIGRVLRRQGFQTHHLINITDVGHLVGENSNGEDKVEKKAKADHKTTKEIVDFYTQAFFVDLAKIAIDRRQFEFPKASDHVADQIELIKKLEAKGFTYQTSDGLYFDTSKYPAYAELGKLDLAGLKEGARVEKNPEKKNPSDFALWKFSRPAETRQQEWDSPWGIGFPGWHIECSAMSMKYLGEHFDIHTGGIDHISVHHSNERAQSEGATGQPFVNYWLHTDFLTVDSQKMAKSLGNFYRLEDLENKGYHPLGFRYFLLSAHYRSALNFTWEALAGAETAWQRLINLAREWKSQAENISGKISVDYQKKFNSFLDNDLNTPQGLALIWDMAKDSNLSPVDKFATLIDFDTVLGLQIAEHLNNEKISTEITLLAEEREKARHNKDWAEADRIRQELADLGYEVLDTETGYNLRPKGQI